MRRRSSIRHSTLHFRRTLITCCCQKGILNNPLTSTENFISYSAVILLKDTLFMAMDKQSNSSNVSLNKLIVLQHMTLQISSLCCVNKQAARRKHLVLHRCSHSVSQSGFYCGMLHTDIMSESVQCVPRPVRFPMAPVMILSAGSVTQSCVILPYCIISIVALFM